MPYFMDRGCVLHYPALIGSTVRKRGKKGEAVPQQPAQVRQNAGPTLGQKMRGRWTPGKSRACLALFTVLCLAPFVGKAFNFDDPLFIWAAKQITMHPLDPYGFQIIWYRTPMLMSEVTKNPPLASYYAALAGACAAWSEWALHLAFLVPALVVVLGVYELSRELTEMPLWAAAATLASPGFLVSATSVMCDVLMLAFWIAAILLWRKGLPSGRPWHLTAGAFAMGCCALTKYFGVALIPLLLVYSAWKKRRLGNWLFYFIIPLAMILAYQLWTEALYGRGLFWDAASYANQTVAKRTLSLGAAFLTGLSFLGGCALPSLFCAPRFLGKKAVAGVFALAVLATAAGVLGWIRIEGHPSVQPRFLAFQLMIFVLSGILVLVAGLSDIKRRPDADAAFLLLWTFGTFAFGAFINWTINARSMLPIIPAAAIFGARGLDSLATRRPRCANWPAAVLLMLSGIISLWVAWGDASLANSARDAAEIIHRKPANPAGKIYFSGHWGFQYYMEMQGARALDFSKYTLSPDDTIVRPDNNTNPVAVPEDMVRSSATVSVDSGRWATTMHGHRWAGFYTSLWGPLPFAFGPVPAEKYLLIRMR
jgi:4-amino-4-deoxy-L-arabinose transferase-like glycosyltransferase